MRGNSSLSHTVWDCKYYVVWIPKYRRKDVEGRARNFVGQSFWARGYYVSTVGRDEEIIRENIRNQEVEDRRLEQRSLLK